MSRPCVHVAWTFPTREGSQQHATCMVAISHGSASIVGVDLASCTLEEQHCAGRQVASPLPPQNEGTAQAVSLVSSALPLWRAHPLAVGLLGGCWGVAGRLLLGRELQGDPRAAPRAPEFPTLEQTVWRLPDHASAGGKPVCILILPLSFSFQGSKSYCHLKKHS